jgi:hypothetical protein
MQGQAEVKAWAWRKQRIGALPVATATAVEVERTAAGVGFAAAAFVACVASFVAVVAAKVWSRSAQDDTRETKHAFKIREMQAARKRTEQRNG